MSIIFDIETAPLPDEELVSVVSPFDEPPHPGEFDESYVKYGNTKDEAKRAAKLEAAKEAHRLACEEHEKTVSAAREQWWSDAKSKAALSATTGMIVAIGYRSTENDKTILHIDEELKLLDMFWKQFEKCRDAGRQMVGHNIEKFDVPFIVRRSWILGIDIPDGVFDRSYLNSRVFIDTMKLWSCGSRDFCKLDSIAKCFGVGGKPEGVDGSMFADLLVTDRAKAEAYLENDLVMTANVAERMGVL